MYRYFLGLGSNVGDSESIIKGVLSAIDGRLGAITSVSQVYLSPPLIPPDGLAIDQADFKNLVLELESEIAPKQLLLDLLKIESQFGRVRDKTTLRWGPRPIDIDIIACGDQIINDSDLKVPHPEMHKRLFVLKPLKELAPNWQHPIQKLSIQQLLKDLEGSMPCEIHAPSPRYECE